MTKSRFVKLLSAAVLSLLATPGCSGQRARVAFASPMGISGSPIVSVSVMFDREIVTDLELGEEIDVARGPFSITPAIAGTFRWEHPDEVVFTTSEAMAEGQIYRVQIDSAQKAIDGAKLDDYRWSFQWDGTQREIESADLAPATDGHLEAIDSGSDDLHDDLEYDADVDEDWGC